MCRVRAGNMGLVLIATSLASLMLASCCLLYPRIRPIEFRVERDDRNLELHVMSMTHGAHRRGEDGVVVADISPGDTDIAFEVRSGTQASQFVARVGADTGVKGARRAVTMTYGFGGGMWLASRDGRHYEIRGTSASRTSFVVGRFLSEGHEPVPRIDAVPPQTEVQLDPGTPGVVFAGRGGASVFARGFANPGTQLDVYAPIGSSLFVEQGHGTQNLTVESVPLRIVMRPGPARIRWLPLQSGDSHVEVVIDAIKEHWASQLAFSSMGK